MDKTGYDLGGAEYPLDPKNLTVVDKEDPNDPLINADIEADPSNPVDWLKADFNRPGWNANFEPRPTIYIGKTLRQVDKSRLASFAVEVNEIWSHRGTLLIFDSWAVIGPFLERLLIVGDSNPYRGEVEVKELSLINCADEEDGIAGEWRVLLYKE